MRKKNEVLQMKSYQQGLVQSIPRWAACIGDRAGAASSLKNQSWTSVIRWVFGQGKGHKISVSERRRNEFLPRTEHL